MAGTWDTPRTPRRITFSRWREAPTGVKKPTMHLSKSILLTLPMTLLLSVGCKKESADSSPPEPVTTAPEPTPEPVATPEPTPEPEPAAAPEPPAPPPLTDGEIATISKAANDGEIEHAKLAKTMAKDKKVKDFAAMMVKDHGDANKRQEALAKKEKIEPKDSELSK
jgi:predicted outer membrane protein